MAAAETTRHFKHGNSHRLVERFRKRFPWLHAIAEVRRRFNYRLEGRHVEIRIAEAP